MAADEPDMDETRAVLDLGEARMVLMAEESYTLIPEKFAESIETVWKPSEGEPAKPEPIALPKPLQGFARAPQVTGKEDANLILEVWVGNGDHSIQHLSFYINPAAAEHAAAWTTLARKIAGTIEAGKRELSFKAHQAKFQMDGATMVMDLPEQWSFSTQRGIDFNVHRLHQVTPLGQPASRCGIYLGDHPRFHYQSSKIDEKEVTAEPGELLGSKTNWHRWNDEGTIMSEAIVQVPGRDLQAHVFMSPAGPDALASVQQIVSTLRLLPPKSVKPKSSETKK
jgi:hypothetical protein